MKHAESMSRLMKKMSEKAKENIDEAQRKDKKYYDLKHSHPKVCVIDTSSHLAFVEIFSVGTLVLLLSSLTAVSGSRQCPTVPNKLSVRLKREH